MPFNYESVEILRKRARLTKGELSDKIGEFAEDKGFEIKGFSRVSAYNWSVGNIPRVNYIDLLYEFAYSLGYFDLDFYKKPKHAKKL